MKKIYRFVVVLITMVCSTHCLLAAQSAKSATIKFVDVEGRSFGYMSPSGEYLCGGWDGGSGFLHNIVSGITSDFSEDGMGGMFVSDVSNNGIVVGSYGEEYTSSPAAIWKNGNWTLLPQPKNYNQGTARTISADGTLIGGYVSIDGMNPTMIPCIWRLKEGRYECELLPCPNKDWNDDILNGVHVLDMSTDGTVLLGRIVDATGSYNLPIVWRQGDSGYTFEILGEDILFNIGKEKPGKMPLLEEYVTAPEGTPAYDEQVEAYMNAWNHYVKLASEYTTGTTIECYWITLSGNGRYISTALRMPDPNADPTDPWGRTLSVPCRFDLSTDTRVTINQFDDALAMYTTNDGFTLIASPQSQNTRTIHVLPVGSTTPILFHEWLMTNYQLDITPDLTFTFEMYDANTGEMVLVTDSVITGSPMITPDGTKIASGLVNPEDNRIVINYMVQLVNGNSVKSTSLSNMKVYVRENELYWEGNVQSVSITDLSGKQVCHQSVTERSISIASLQAGVYLVRFTTDNQEEEIHKIVIRK